MKIRRFAYVILAMLVTASFASADTTASWGGDGVTTNPNLRWKSPTAKSSSRVVTADLTVAATEDGVAIIRQVQHTTPPLGPPAAKPAMTPAQRDTVFPELRPQSVTPPSGATLTPSRPSSSPSTYSSPARPETISSPATSSSSSSGSSSGPSTPAALSKPETPAVELKNPALDTTAVGPMAGPAADGTAPAPRPSDRYTPAEISSRNKEIECPDTTQQTGSIRDISYDIRPMPGPLPKECPLNTTQYTGRHFGQTCFQWKASALCTKAAYFEDVQLERYGHSVCPMLEPIISGTRFFLTVPMLPYKMGLQTPDECVYTLGHYRVGSCAPYMLDPFPITIRAMLFEGAAIGGAVALIP